MAIKPGVRYTEKFRNVGETRAMMLENLSLFTCRLTSFISQECFSIYSKIFSRFLRGNLALVSNNNILDILVFNIGATPCLSFIC